MYCMSRMRFGQSEAAAAAVTLARHATDRPGRAAGLGVVSTCSGGVVTITARRAH